MREGVLHEGSTASRGAFFCVGYRVDATDMTRPVVYLNYTASDRGATPRHFQYPVFLQTARPHLGGLRWSFTCLLCRRRLQKLYHPPGRDASISEMASGLKWATELVVMVRSRP